MRNEKYTAEFVVMMQQILSGTGLEHHVQSMKYPVIEKATGHMWWVVDGDVKNGVTMFTLHNPVSKQIKQALAIEVWFLSPVEQEKPKSPEATLEIWVYSPTCKSYSQAIDEDCISTYGAHEGALEDLDALFRLATLETALFNASMGRQLPGDRIEYVLTFNDGTEEVKKTRVLQPGCNRSDEDDRREFATQLGMAHGVDAYNDAMGYSVGADEDALESERFETCNHVDPDDFDMF